MKKVIGLAVLCAALAISTVCVARDYVGPGEDYEEYFEEVGEVYHICPELLQAILETDYRRSDLVGPMKLNRAVQEERMDKLQLHNLHNKAESLEIGADYLYELFEKHEDIYTVLQIYLELPDKYSEVAEEIVDQSYRLEKEHGKLDY